MARVHWRASNLLNPLPVVLVSCTDENGKSNVMTAAWAGTVCSDPVMVSVSIRKSRYSHEIISKTGEFVINLPSEEQVLYTDYVGIYSGRKVDKFALEGPYKATPVASEQVKAVTIEECPIALECKVKQVLELGSHDMFVAEVVSVSVNEKCVNSEGRLDMSKAKLVSYSHGEYFALGRKLGKFGYSSNKKERSRRTEIKNQQRRKQK